MRRAPIVLAATVAGFAGVLSFHTSGTTVTLGGAGGSSTSTGSSTGPSSTPQGKGKGTSSASTASSGSSSTASSGSSSAGGSSSGGSSAGGSTHGATGGARSSSGAARSGASGGTTAPGPTTGVRSATGTAENFGYGVMAVKVTVNGSRITAITVPTLQVAEPTSQEICAQAIPMLRSEVLTAQSARINAISGATYTSEAYDYSLQSALDKLHVK